MALPEEITWLYNKTFFKKMYPFDKLKFKIPPEYEPEILEFKHFMDYCKKDQCCTEIFKYYIGQVVKGTQIKKGFGRMYTRNCNSLFVTEGFFGYVDDTEKNLIQSRSVDGRDDRWHLIYQSIPLVNYRFVKYENGSLRSDYKFGTNKGQSIINKEKRGGALRL